MSLEDWSDMTAFDKAFRDKPRHPQVTIPLVPDPYVPTVARKDAEVLVRLVDGAMR